MTKTTMYKVVIACMVGATLAGCGNAQIIDTTWNYDEAIIVIGGEEVARGQVTSWRDYSESDVVQVRMVDGTTYYTHSTNVVLIDNPNK